MLLPLALVGLNAAFQLLASKLARDEDPATLGGWIVFSHWPDGWAVLGIGGIMGCGALGTWLTRREQREERRAAPIDSTLGGA
jgi:hypothetical protein